MEISYRFDEIPETGLIIDLYYSSGINRPIADKGRIGKMYSNSDLIVTARDKEKLIGVARSLTDYCYCCYLSDLAVRKEYQGQGIGKELIRLTKQHTGDQAMLLQIGRAHV